jgi:hypothetical protein
LREPPKDSNRPGRLKVPGNWVRMVL